MAQPPIIIVGASKPVLNYVTACITVFNQGNSDVVLKARGNAINIQVEVVQLLRSRFMKDVIISHVAIDGETVTTRDGRALSLPVMDITLSKRPKH